MSPKRKRTKHLQSILKAWMDEQAPRFKNRQLNVSFNDCHPDATYLYGVTLFLDLKSRICARLTYGYPRDGSSWSVSYDDWDTDCWLMMGDRISEKAAVGQMLRQKRSESPEECLKRMELHISLRCLPRTESEQLRAEDREKLYGQFSHRLHDLNRGDFQSGKFQSDARTRALFAPGYPYSRNEEVASMLADLLQRPTESICSDNAERVAEQYLSGGELEMLSQSLRAIRRLRPANTALSIFQSSLGNRNYGYGHRQPEERPDYAALRRGLKLARRARARVLLWVPRSEAMTGLVRVPLRRVRFDLRRNRLRFEGEWLDVGVIREIEALL